MSMKNLLPLIILLAVVLGCNAPRSSSTAATATPTPVSRKLSAHVELTQRGIIVKNTDTVDFPSVAMKLNLKNWGSDDGQASAGTLPQGKTITVPYGEFTVDTTRFDPRKTKIMTVYVKAGDGAARLFLCASRVCQTTN